MLKFLFSFFLLASTLSIAQDTNYILDPPCVMEKRIDEKIIRVFKKNKKNTIFVLELDGFRPYETIELLSLSKNSKIQRLQMDACGRFKGLMTPCYGKIKTGFQTVTIMTREDVITFGFRWGEDDREVRF